MVIIIGIILQIIAAVATIVGGVTAIKNKKLVDFIAGVVAALATMGIGFLTVDLHEPNILRKDDYSAIVLEADKGVAIEYKIGKGENEFTRFNLTYLFGESIMIRLYVWAFMTGHDNALSGF